MKNEILGYIVAVVILVFAFIVYRLVVTGWFENVSGATLFFYAIVIALVAIGVRAFCKMNKDNK